MKYLIMTSAAFFLMGLFMSPVLAESTSSNANKAEQKGVEQSAVQKKAASGKSNVPQAQIDYRQKRDDAKKMRKEMLKLRQKNINGGQGTTPDEVFK